MKNPKYYIKTSVLRIMSVLAPKILKSPSLLNIKNNYKTEVSDSDFDLRYYYSFHFYRFHENIKLIYAWDQEGYPFNYSESPKHYTNPLTVAQYLLMLSVQEGFWEDEVKKQEFCKIAQHLDQLGTWEKGFFIWRIDQDVPKFLVARGFSSGIFQACGLSAYLRWHLIAPSEALKSKIDSIYQSLKFPLEDGGFYTLTEESLPWLEEYPAKQAVHVLNGHLYGVVAAYEYTYFMKLSFDFAERLLESFLTCYHEFRFGSYLKYCRYYPMLCNVTYQMLHDQQLIHLSQLTGRSRIFELQREWAQSYNRVYCMQQLSIKLTSNSLPFEGPSSWRSLLLLR